MTADPDPDALLPGWHLGLIAPAPRRPVDEPLCPRCQSRRTVSHGARAHCGRCGAEWQCDAVERAPGPDMTDVIQMALWAAAPAR